MVFSTAFLHEGGPFFSRKRPRALDHGHRDIDLHADAGISSDFSFFSSDQNIERYSIFSHYMIFWLVLLVI